MTERPIITPGKNCRELTLRSIVIAVFLTVILAMSNSYLALKLGILTSASIPAAIISIGILRFFKNGTILENNAVQTAASAGEAVAGGIVYTIPALIIIGYWNHFDYWTNFFIAAMGGVLGVLFSIPLRRILVNDSALKFPEGRAIAEVLKSSSEHVSLREIFIGGAIGASLELVQMGFKIIANSVNYWFVIKRSLFGVGLGFSATMIGAGYLIGGEMAFSIFLGAVIAWLIALPITSNFYPEFLLNYPTVHEAANALWDKEMRYLGIGAMLFAGSWTFITLLPPLLKSIKTSVVFFRINRKNNAVIPRVDRDIPLLAIGVAIMLSAVLLFFGFQQLFPLSSIGVEHGIQPLIIGSMVLYVLGIGFLFSVITGYLSGMVGVTASPGSSVVIAGMLFAAWILLTVLHSIVPLPLSSAQIKAAEAITIIIGSVVTGIAAIANDNSQDLKVGQLVGATPWRQQLMLLLGVMVSALVIPPVMQLLFEVYGIANVMPHAGMDVSQALPAPTAALMAAITDAVFQHTLPWAMMAMGAGVIVVVLATTKLLKLNRLFKVSILGVAIGMYLPLASSFPLFLGGLLAVIVQYRLQRKNYSVEKSDRRRQVGVLISCGLVAGAALMEVVLAIPFSIMHSPNALSLVGESWSNYAVALAIITTVALMVWIDKKVVRGL